jgi:ribosomal protein S6
MFGRRVQMPPCASGQSLYKAAFLPHTPYPAQSLVGRARQDRSLCPVKCAPTELEYNMPLYEHVMIARQDLSSAQAEGLMDHLSTILSDNGGKVVGTEYWGVKTMAYKINKNRKGHYAFLRSDAPAEAVQEMERLARLHDDVMRVLTVKVEGHDDGPSVQMQKRDDRGDRGDRPRR